MTEEEIEKVILTVSSALRALTEEPQEEPQNEEKQKSFIADCSMLLINDEVISSKEAESTYQIFYEGEVVPFTTNDDGTFYNRYTGTVRKQWVADYFSPFIQYHTKLGR